jgi:hypothetical protein
MRLKREEELEEIRLKKEREEIESKFKQEEAKKTAKTDAIRAENARLAEE